MPWKWPLLSEPVWPDEPGQFGTVRRHDIHTGVDLYCPINTTVVAVEDGRVVRVEDFTGPNASDPSPWWHDTQAILVEGRSGVVVYGELSARVMAGDHVVAGEILGVVDRPILRKFKGRPMVMLHVELMERGNRQTVWWEIARTDPPAGLLDPSSLLKEAAGKALRQFVLADWNYTSFLPPEL